MATSTRTERTRLSARQSPPDLPSVLAIVVTHNGREWLRDCLVGLANQSYSILDVLVVDDATAGHRSERPSVRRIAKRHLRRRRWGYLRTPRPLGFGGAINWALGRVRTNADFLLFIHDDAALSRDSVEHMVQRLTSDDQTAIVGPKVVGWDDPARLEEVGMAADRFGYPYKGLEEGEIDLGQHDTAAEVFYVTSTCMLMRHEVFRALHGWDARMRAFAEDLDICWRARLAGHNVRVEPRAKARHAIALARGVRSSPFKPTRYYVRRNRFRSVTKNASGIRLIALVPQFLLLSFVEMIAFIFLRQPGEIVNLCRAIAWNGIRLPQTLAERTRVQRRRQVPDRKLLRVTVRETTRIRFYVGHQATRLEDAWGRRAELLQARGGQLRSFSERLAGWQGAVLGAVLLVVLLGFRHVLWSDPASTGELLPYPEQPTALMRAYFSPWNGSGLGHPNASPAGFWLLGLVPLATLGATGLAQKTLIVLLGAIAFAGAYRMVSEVVDRPARLVSGLAYAFGAVGYAGIRGGNLGALVFGAAAPFVVGSMLRLLGWTRPPRFHRGRAIARVALGAAVSAAFVPGSLFLYLATGAVLAATRTIWARGEKVLRGLVACVVALATSWTLLLPWSATWTDRGGPLGKLMGDATWRRFAAVFDGHGMTSVVLGQMPEGMVFFGLALALLGIIAVLVGDGARRRLALALWAAIALCGWLSSAFAAGLVRPLVASPTELGVISSVAFAGLVGLAVGAFRLDLPRRGLGWIHALTISGLAVSGFLVAAGIGPALWRGDWDPGMSAVADGEIRAQVTALLESEAQQVGDFRTLWVGERWSAAVPSAIGPSTGFLLSDPGGQDLTDLFGTPTGPGERRLREVVSSIEDGGTDLGGHFLGSFNVDFVVLDRTEASPWLGQRDLALIRTEPDYLVLRNEAALAHAALYEQIPAAPEAVETKNAALFANGDSPEIVSPVTQRSASSFEADGVSGPATLFLADSFDEGWTARLGGAEIERSEAGWGNAWALPAESSGRLTVSFERTDARAWVLFGVIIAWAITIGAAFSSRRAQIPGVRR
jgi:GT2 family glycosyltransferase